MRRWIFSGFLLGSGFWCGALIITGTDGSWTFSITIGSSNSKIEGLLSWGRSSPSGFLLDVEESVFGDGGIGDEIGISEFVVVRIDAEGFDVMITCWGDFVN